ncbi:hypothetical protein ACFQMM_23005 [Saliphagus sp. GCM10025308]
MAVLIMFYQPQGFIPWLIERGRKLIGADEESVSDENDSPLRQSMDKLRNGFQDAFNRGGEK